MGYLVKTSFNAEPRSYVLEGIRADVRGNLLPLSALVRHKDQSFWYSVGELVGASPTPSQRYLCPFCKDWIVARKIDMGLLMKCGKCQVSSEVPDLEARQRAVQNHDAPKQNKGLMIGGGLMTAVGVIATAASYFSAGQAGPGARGYAVFTGLIVIGLGTFHQGWTRRALQRHKSSESKK